MILPKNHDLKVIGKKNIYVPNMLSRKHVNSTLVTRMAVDRPRTAVCSQTKIHTSIYSRYCFSGRDLFVDGIVFVYELFVARRDCVANDNPRQNKAYTW